MNKRIIAYGIMIGIVNVLLGSCGGILAVSALKQNSLSQNKAQATSIAIIFPLAIASACIYIYNNKVNISETTVFIIPGLLGALIGSFVLPKINSKLLKKIFAGLIIYAGVRMLFK